MIFLEFGHWLKRHNALLMMEKIKPITRISIGAVLLVSAYYLGLLNGKVNIALGDYHNVILYFLTSIYGTLGVMFFSGSIRGVAGKWIGFYGKNSLCFFCVHSFYLYLYAFVLSHALGTPYMLMNNISLSLSFVGFMLVLITSIPIKFIYDRSVGKLVMAINNMICQKEK